MTEALEILLLATLGSLISLSGGVVFLLVKPWKEALTKYSIPFAAGVLVTTALLGLLPEATHMIEMQAYLIVLLSFLGSYLFESLFFDIHHHSHEDEGHGDHIGSVPLIIFGDTIHNFIDGVAIAAAYLIHPGLGLMTAVSTFLHEVPHEIGDFGILLHSGFSKTKVFLINLFSALSTLVGAMVVYYWMPGDQLTGSLLAVAAGMFLYLGASDFLPKVDQGTNKFKSIMILLVGIAAMYIAMSIIPHSE